MSLTVKQPPSVLFVTVKSINPSLKGGVGHVPVLGEHRASQKKTSAIAQKVVSQPSSIPLPSSLSTKSPTVQMDTVRSESEKENRKENIGPILVRTRSDVFSREYLSQMNAAMQLEEEKDKNSKSEKVERVFSERSKGSFSGKDLLKQHHAHRLRGKQMDSSDSDRMSSSGRIKYYRCKQPQKLLPY
jgi:hypothetical protein